MHTQITNMNPKDELIKQVMIATTKNRKLKQTLLLWFVLLTLTSTIALSFTIYTIPLMATSFIQVFILRHYNPKIKQIGFYFHATTTLAFSIAACCIMTSLTISKLDQSLLIILLIHYILFSGLIAIMYHKHVKLSLKAKEKRDWNSFNLNTKRASGYSSQFQSIV